MRVLVLLLLELVHFGVAYAVPVDVEAMAQQASRVAVELPDPLPARLLEPRPVPAVTARPKAKARDKGWLGLGVKRKIAAGSYSAATASVAGAAALVYNGIQTADKTHERKVHRTACRSTRKRAFSESFLLKVEDYGKMTAATEALTAGLLAVRNSVLGHQNEEC